MASVYVETSIFGALVERRRDLTSRYQYDETIAWWESRDRYDLFVSQAVLDELGSGEFDGQAAAVKLAVSLPMLRITEEVVSLSRYYRTHMLMPAKEAGDAMHLAVATVYGVDYLLTWNCRHLANVNKVNRLKAVHAQLGRPTPLIVTPPFLE